MSLATRLVRFLSATAVVGSAALISHADAVTKPIPTTTKVYFHGSGCPLEDSWLDLAATKDSADGCGIAGGPPAEEVIGATPVDFATKKTFKPIKLDPTKKVTGIYAVDGWALVGAGEVVVDVSMTAKTKTGKTINFGDTTGTVTTVAVGHANVPFTFANPASAKGQQITKIAITVAQHGKNYGFNAYSFSGTSYVNFPGFK
jgi:hypothetical protein